MRIARGNGFEDTCFMIPYWALFSFLSLFAVTAAGNIYRRPPALALFAVAVTIALMIGLRYQVGGDWANYVGHYNRTTYMSFGDVIAGSDPGYYLVNWLSNRLGGGIWSVTCSAESPSAPG